MTHFEAKTHPETAAQCIGVSVENQMNTVLKKCSMLSNLSPISSRPQRLSDRVYETLCDAIVEGKLPPGERLRETEVASALRVSRTPVRAAFARLIQQRMLRTDASGAYYIAEWDRKTLWEIATLRASLESLAFSLALQNLSQEDFDHLEGITRQMGEMDADPASGDYKQMALFDFQFHTYIWSRKGHDLLEQALENIKPQAHYYMYLTRQASQLDYAERHCILIEFLKQGDRSKVNEIMLDHILPSAEKAIAWWERRQEKMAEEQEVTE
ncbi:MAG: GntR family transcriptional regulator [Anaerolineae bacterium]